MTSYCFNCFDHSVVNFYAKLKSILLLFFTVANKILATVRTGFILNLFVSMWYRTSLHKINKEVYSDYKKMSREDFFKKYWEDSWGEEYLDVHKFLWDTVHNFWKYLAFTSEGLTHLCPEADYTDGELAIMSKEKLWEIIQVYKKEVIEYFTKVIDVCRNIWDYDQDSLEESLAGMVFSMQMKVSRLKRLSKDDTLDIFDDKFLAIYKLLDLYRTWDWENDLIVYYGW